MKIYTADELFEAWANQESFVTVDDNAITIDVKYPYHIERDRCDTEQKILGWMVHLCEKTWMTPVVLREFAHAAANAAGIKITFA